MMVFLFVLSVLLFTTIVAVVGENWPKFLLIFVDIVAAALAVVAAAAAASVAVAVADDVRSMTRLC